MVTRVGQLLLRSSEVGTLRFECVNVLSLPALGLLQPFIADGGSYCSHPPERRVGKVFYFCKESEVTLRERGAGAERESTCLSNFHERKLKHKMNEGLFGLQWPYLCRKRCFTVVAHNRRFWQMYFAWNIVLKLYCLCAYVQFWECVVGTETCPSHRQYRWAPLVLFFLHLSSSSVFTAERRQTSLAKCRFSLFPSPWSSSPSPTDRFLRSNCFVRWASKC